MASNSIPSYMLYEMNYFEFFVGSIKFMNHDGDGKEIGHFLVEIVMQSTKIPIAKIIINSNLFEMVDSC